MSAVLAVLSGINGWSVAFRLFLAVVIGGCIGMERGRHGRAAGLRTHILVCLGATLTTLLGLFVHYQLGFANDPLRMGAQVISGIGFLGVGTIMIRKGAQVKGLTTAAGLWATACVGLTVGAGFYVAAMGAFMVIIATNSLLARLERMKRNQGGGSYYVELADIRDAKALYREMNERILDAEIVPAKSGLPNHVGLEIVTDASDLMTRLQEKDSIMIVLPVHT